MVSLWTAAAAITETGKQVFEKLLLTWSLKKKIVLLIKQVYILQIGVRGETDYNKAVKNWFVGC